MPKLLALFAIAMFTASCSLVANDTPVASTDQPSSVAFAAPAPGEVVIDELNVSYFKGWPLPPQIGQADGSFAAAVGAGKINWIPADSGGEMADQMERGEVDIAFSMGLTPFANRVNAGADFKLVGVAVSYAEADACVAQSSLGLTRQNAAEVLNGKTILTPIGNVTHFKMLSIMEFLGVDIDSLEIVEAESRPATATAFRSGEIDVGCAFGGSVVDMLDTGGELILTGAEIEDEIGIRTYDITAIPTAFGRENPEVVAGFVRATEEFNQRWAADPDANNAVIATAAEMDSVGDFLGGEVWFSFPTTEEQLSADWLGGNVAETMRGQLSTFERLGVLDTVLDDFAPFIDSSYLAAAAQ